MRPVFASSAWVAAPERAILRHGRWQRRLLQVRYGLFIHPRAGPTLIDTGYTRHCLDMPGRSLALRSYARLLSPRLVAQEQAKPFLTHFGLTPADISHVIVTHFHADHVSGLAAFPNARFTASGTAWAQVKRNSAFQNLRHGVFAELIPNDFDTRLDVIEQTIPKKIAHLPDGHDIFGDGSVLAVPLRGHADGHFGLLFDQLDVPLLYATDTQWVSEALLPERRPRLFPRLISNSFKDVARSSDQVAAFADAGGTVMLCHDDAPSFFDYAQGAVL
jgi:glyoxylase-like metal-dependent hydrolase (beta-lactamase superfamily II)